MIGHIDYIMTVILFTIGLYGLVIKTNLIKKLIGLNIMETSVYLFFIAIGDVRFGSSTSLWAKAPFIHDPAQAARGLEPMVNPVPTALVLTAIVVSMCITALALSIAVVIYKRYGTLDTRKLSNLKG